MRERICNRRFSGWSLDIPEGLTLTARDIRTGVVVDLSDDLHYWMRASFENITNYLGDGWAPRNF
jgi:hypothetical protein